MLITNNHTQTKLRATKKIVVNSDLVGEEMLNEFKRQHSAYKAAKARIFEAASRHDELKTISGQPLSIEEAKEGQFELEFSFVVVVEGNYEKIPEIPQLAYTDPKTLNQLINSKLLTDDQKKELLVAHKIIPREFINEKKD